MRQHSNYFSVLHYDQTARNRAIGRCLFFLQSCSTSNYVRSVAMSWFQSDVCVMERLRKKILFKLSVRVEVSSVESNETTAATVSCDLAPPPQRRRRRHPPPPPPRNLPFVTFQGSKETYLSLHNQTKQVRVQSRQTRVYGL